MITEKSLSFSRILKWAWHHMVWLLLFSASVAFFYHEGYIKFELPWLPVSVVGTAVAFYVGFKNNQAYDRMWEARKIWGAIVNSSRTWGMQVDSFVSNQFSETPASAEELKIIKKRLMYRHIGWLYTLRSQLLIPTEWEHVNQDKHTRRLALYFQNNFGVGLVADEVTKIELKHYLPEDELQRLIDHKNSATQIINEQSRDLAKLRSNDLIDDFRHMEMEKVLADFYTHQGKCERIKKFPLPRQYANMSRYFAGIFIAMLPFSMIPELLKMGEWAFWLSIPITALIGWIYVMMEVVGDYSENPFQGMANDIPMLSLCRTIEIDLMEMLGETELPEPVKSKNGILM